MKKTYYLIAALLIMVFALTGCGSDNQAAPAGDNNTEANNSSTNAGADEGADEVVTVTFWHGYNADVETPLLENNYTGHGIPFYPDCPLEPFQIAFEQYSYLQ